MHCPHSPAATSNFQVTARFSGSGGSLRITDCPSCLLLELNPATWPLVRTATTGLPPLSPPLWGFGTGAICIFPHWRLWNDSD